MQLETIGFSTWHKEAFEDHLRDGWHLLRVISVHRSNWILSDGQAETRAELTGRMSYSADSPLNLPTTGDWVLAQLFDEGTFAVIDLVLPRRTELKRKAAGVDINYQLLAANVDTAIIAQACEGDFNPRRLERYLITVREGHVEPIVLLTKTDLVSDSELADLKDQINRIAPGVDVLTYSMESPESLIELQKFMQPGLTYCLLGSSGVGKTTITNALLGDVRFETKTVREDDQMGRHTTTSRNLVQLPSGALLIDTPGMRELGTMGAESGIAETFADIEALAQECRFSDCSHSEQAGCAILAAIESETLDPGRLKSYQKLERESRRNEMSLAERRKKDKDLGKFYKSVIQSKKDRR